MTRYVHLLYNKKFTLLRPVTIDKNLITIFIFSAKINLDLEQALKTIEELKTKNKNLKRMLNYY